MSHGFLRGIIVAVTSLLPVANPDRAVTRASGVLFRRICSGRGVHRCFLLESVYCDEVPRSHDPRQIRQSSISPCSPFHRRARTYSLSAGKTCRRAVCAIQICGSSRSKYLKSCCRKLCMLPVATERNSGIAGYRAHQRHCLLHPAGFHDPTAGRNVTGCVSSGWPIRKQSGSIRWSCSVFASESVASTKIATAPSR